MSKSRKTAGVMTAFVVIIAVGMMQTSRPSAR
jgi:hypothetical protein